MPTGLRSLITWMRCCDRLYGTTWAVHDDAKAQGWVRGRVGSRRARTHVLYPQLFDHAEQFDQQRIRLADIDGSGTRVTSSTWATTASGSTSTNTAIAGARPTGCAHSRRSTISPRSPPWTCSAPTPTSHSDAPRVGLRHPGDGNAMGRYLKQYEYDEVGNMLEMIHRGIDPSHPGWSRCYQFAEDSNRLLSAGHPSDPQFPCLTHYAPAPVYSEVYTYNTHGNMTRLPHLPLMECNFKDQLQSSARQVVNNGGTPETTYYAYDASGQRVRKITEDHRSSAFLRKCVSQKERAYLSRWV